MKTIIFAALLVLAPMAHSNEPPPTEPFGARCEAPNMEIDEFVRQCAVKVREKCHGNFEILTPPPVMMSDPGAEPKWIQFVAKCSPTFLQGSI